LSDLSLIPKPRHLLPGFSFSQKLFLLTWPASTMVMVKTSASHDHGLHLTVVQGQKCPQREQKRMLIMLLGLMPGQPKGYMHGAPKTDLRDCWNAEQS